MNVERATLVRRGYLLTALALAVLLAASSGTAWAQSLRFNTSRATVEEGANAADNAAPTPVRVTISRSAGGFDGPDGDDADTLPDARISDASDHVEISVLEYDGSPYDSNNFPFAITQRSGDATSSTPVAIGTAFSFGTDSARSSADGRATAIELTISHTGDNGDWNEETLVLQLSASSALTTHLTGINRTLTYGTRRLTVTVEDDDPMPQFRFEKPDIQLAAGNTQTVKVGVGIGAARGAGEGTIQGTLFALDGGVATSGATGDEVLLAVEPADAVGKIIKITKDVGGNANALVARGPGEYVLGTIGGTAGVGLVTAAADSTATDGIELTIEAIGASGFRDERISLTLKDGRTDAEKMGEGGPIDDSAPTAVTVLSGAETPTVTFSTDAVTIDEGGTETVHILADTDQGDQVGAVSVSVIGDATIVLEQGGSQISGGAVDFGGGANAEVTIRALGDLTLEDGEEKMATVTITDAGGANIGDPAELTVTVTGSTAVPVLPLVGQLILALLLTAGGARLYRRRQQ